ncbi:MAG: endo-1,4-beta-xylanase, partial [Phycisphaerae bacterium]|nr:endo-1,4-beta-xylanase [Phycisphaerae bacterium]
TIPPVDASTTDWHDDWPDTVSRDCLVEWFNLARKCDPKAKLILNNSGILTYRGTNVTCWKYNEKMLDYLVEHDAPLDVIAEEAHFVQDLTDPAKVIEILDRFSKYKKEFWITEFDVITPDDQLQADYTRDFLTACFSHPSVGAFLLWGFWEANHWQPSAAMYRNDWTPKPSGKVWEDLVLHKWWTREEGKTNAAGEYKTRGFLGDYVVEVRSGGKTVKRKFKLPKEGTTLEVSLP